MTIVSIGEDNAFSICTKNTIKTDGEKIILDKGYISTKQINRK